MLLNGVPLSVEVASWRVSGQRGDRILVRLIFVQCVLSPVTILNTCNILQVL